MKRPLSSSKITIKSYDELFGGSPDNEEYVQEIPIASLHEFQNHPFRVVDDDEMKQLVESIKEFGVLVPGLARPLESGGYEIVSGHRRTYASKLAGKTTVPMIVRKLDDEDAITAMVDANLQREFLLPSEKAKAYRMKYDAVRFRRNGKKGSNLDLLGEAAGESGKTVQRYVAMSYLIPELLELVDVGTIGLYQAVTLSNLSDEAQKWLVDCLTGVKMKLSMKKAEKLKECYKANLLTEEIVWSIIEDKPVQERKITLNNTELKNYFPVNTSEEDMKELIISLLEKWKEEGGCVK